MTGRIVTGKLFPSHDIGEEREIFRYENGTIQSKDMDKLIREILRKGDD